jgi:hypothetical protein
MGLAIGMAGVTFPVVISLLGPDPSMGMLMSVSGLAFTFGYAGMLLSPVHVCLIVTNKFFETSLFYSIKKTLPPVLTVIGGGILLSRLWLFLF